MNANKPSLHKLCLVAVDIRSAHNVGSMFRTCDGFGAEIFLVGLSPRPEHDNDNRLPHISKRANREIAKTALGAQKTVKFRYTKTFEECCRVLREEGYSIIAIEQTTISKSIDSLKVTKDTALVVGREVEGLSSVEISLCDEVYEIPMVGSKESFNVAVACGIALYRATNSVMV